MTLARSFFELAILRGEHHGSLHRTKTQDLLPGYALDSTVAENELQRDEDEVDRVDGAFDRHDLEADRKEGEEG